MLLLSLSQHPDVTGTSYQCNEFGGLEAGALPHGLVTFNKNMVSHL